MREEDAVAKWARRFEDQVWYNRHLLRAKAIARDNLTLVDDAQPTPPGSLPTLSKAVWERACAHARCIEAEIAEVGSPSSDYEWGKINGKLSALRWVLGLEWDMLDT